jgi:hypothetical protein
LNKFLISLIALVGVVSGTVRTASDFTSLQTAVSALVNGDSINLTNDITFTATITVSSKNNITFYSSNSVRPILTIGNRNGFRMSNSSGYTFKHLRFEYGVTLTGAMRMIYHEYNNSGGNKIIDCVAVGDGTNNSKFYYPAADNYTIDHIQSIIKATLVKNMVYGTEFAVTTVANVLIDSCMFVNSTPKLYRKSRLMNSVCDSIGEIAIKSDSTKIYNVWAAKSTGEIVTFDDIDYYVKDDTIRKVIIYRPKHTGPMIDATIRLVMDSVSLCHSTNMSYAIYAHGTNAFDSITDARISNFIVYNSNPITVLWGSNGTIINKLFCISPTGSKTINWVRSTNDSITNSMFSYAPTYQAATPNTRNIQTGFTSSKLTDTVYQFVKMKYLADAQGMNFKNSILSIVKSDSVTENTFTFKGVVSEWFKHNNGNEENFLQTNSFWTGDTASFKIQYATDTLSTISNGVTVSNRANDTVMLTQTSLTSSQRYFYRVVVNQTSSSPDIVNDTSQWFDVTTAGGTPPLTFSEHAFFVSPTGSNSNDGSLANPWKDIGYALCGGSYGCPCVTDNPNVLMAGDTLYLTDGEYTENNLRIENTGTISNPVVIRSYPGIRASINGNNTAKIFKLGENSTPSNGIVFDSIIFHNSLGDCITMGSADTVRNVTIKNCEFYDYFAADNTAGVNVYDRAYNVLIDNCVFRGASTFSVMSCGVQMWRGDGSRTVQNCEMYNNQNGIFYKHSSLNPIYRTLIQNNYIHDNHAYGIMLSSNNAIVKNNLVINNNAGTNASGAGISVWESAGGTGGGYSRFEHNTVYGSRDAFLINSGGQICAVTGDYGATHDTLYNNVLINNYSSGYPLAIWPYTTYPTYGPHYTVTDYNNYVTARSGSIVIREYYTGTTDFTLVTWQTKYPLMDANSTIEAPTFANASGNLNTIADFAITGGGGNNAASDGTDMGANIDSVGPNWTYIYAKVPATITTQPQPQTVNVGQTATFSVVASGSNLTYVWHKGGDSVGNQSTYSFVATMVDSGLPINCAVQADTGDPVVSATVIANVSELIQPPLLVVIADTLTLCTDATTECTYQWYTKTGGAITGATEGCYTVVADSAAYASKLTYYCIVTNAGGSTNSNEWLISVGSGGGNRRGNRTTHTGVSTSP